MTHIALRGLLARKLRSFMTGFAVVIGVAFVAGTLVYTDTIDESFKDLFQRLSKGTDVQVSAKDPIDADFEMTANSFDQSLLDRVKGIDGVAAVDGNIDAQATLFKGEERVGSAQQGPAVLGNSSAERFDPADYVEGERITDPNKVGIDQSTAEKEDLGIGDKLTIAGEGPAKTYEVGAVFKLGDQKSLGLPVAIVTLAEAQKLGDRVGKLDEIRIAAERGTNPEQLRDRVQAALRGENVIVETGKDAADRQSSEITDELGFLSTALLVFAGVSLLVGAFLIFNTFAITVAQRQREFALLRTIGGSRAQVMRAVLLEAVIIGLVASAIGCLLGLALAPGLNAMLGAFGLTLPNTGTVILPRTIIIGLLIGTVTTLVAGIVPARRATSVKPMEALRDAALPSARKIRKRRIALAAALLAIGVAVTLTGLFSEGDESAIASMIGGGALLAIFGVALLAPILVRPLAHAIGQPLERVFGITGRLGRENAERQPHRTAITASALMIGLALVVFVATFAAGLKSSVRDAVQDDFQGSLIVQSEDGFSPIPAQAATSIREVPGVEAVSPVRFQPTRVTGDEGVKTVSGVDPATIVGLMRIKWVKGTPETLTSLAENQLAIEEGTADKLKLGVGDEVQLLTPSGKREPFTIAGVYENRVGLLGDFVATNAALERFWNARSDAVVLVAGGDKKAVERALQPFPVAETLTKSEFIDDQSAQVDQLVGLIYGLLALSVIVSLLGIVNTLALAIHERHRELGMIRAVGMRKGQIKSMVRQESVITSLIGAALGVVLGTLFAFLISRPLEEDGFVFSIPVGTLVFVTVLAVLFGILAAMSPARRAAKTDILQAITSE